LSGRAWIDGAARGNPGDAGFGVRFEIDGRVEEITGFIGTATNNVAEYAALLAALTYARRLGVGQLLLLSDSQLLVRQMLGEYRVKARHLKPLFLQAVGIRKKIPRFEIRHVPRKENRDADRLANKAIDQQSLPPDWFRLELPVASS
jgi:ribonuclease HI